MKCNFDHLNICNNDQDYFAIPVLVGQQIVANAEFSHSSGDLRMILYDTDGESGLRWANTQTDNETLVYSAPSSGTLYLRVFGVNYFDKNDYNLTIEIIGESCEADDLETNNSFFEAYNISDDLVQVEAGVQSVTYSNNNTTPNGLSVCNNAQDYFAIPVLAGQQIIANAEFTHEDGDLRMILYDSDGESGLRSANTQTDNETLVFTSTGSGTLYLRVFGVNYYDKNSYNLTLQVIGEACEEDALEPNNSFYESIEVAEVVRRIWEPQQRGGRRQLQPAHNRS